MGCALLVLLAGLGNVPRERFRVRGDDARAPLGSGRNFTLTAFGCASSRRCLEFVLLLQPTGGQPQLLTKHEITK